MNETAAVGPSISRSRHPRVIEGVCWIVVAASVLLLIGLVHRFAVPVPMQDDWEMAPLIIKSRTGGLSFSDFFDQQQESRTLIPKLLFVLLAQGKHWDVRVEMGLSIGICLATVVGIYTLLRETDFSAREAALALGLIVPLVFSPVQHELWLLASGFPSFIPALCIIGGLAVAMSRITTSKKLFACGFLSFFSSFSLASGLLAWGLTFPAWLIVGRIRAWKPWLTWFGLSALCGLLYFYHFKKPNDLPPFAPVRSALDYALYLLAFLGSGIGRAGNGSPLGASILIGAVALAAYLGALAYAVVNRGDGEKIKRLVPWLAVGCYPIACGVLAALGRIAWGVSQSLESRYVPFSLYLFVAVIALSAIVLRDIRASTTSHRREWSAICVTVFFASLYLSLHIRCAAASLEMFAVRSVAARLSYVAVMFSQVLNTSQVIKSNTHPQPAFVRQNADALDRLHLLYPPLFRTLNLSQMRLGKADGSAASGWLGTLSSSEGGGLNASGWAILNSKTRPADGVILAYATANQWKAVTISSAVTPRADVAEFLHESKYRLSGWYALFPASAIPAGARISAWAVDARDAKLYQLNSLQNRPSSAAR